MKRLALLLLIAVPCFAQVNNPSVAANASPANGLNAQFRLSEGVGSTAYDSGPNALNATWTGTAAGANGYYSAGAVSLWAGFFDGSTDFIDAGANAALGPGAMTVTAWIYPTALTNAYSTVVQKGDATNYYEIYVKSTGKMAFLVGTTGQACSADGTGTAVLTVNTWHFIAMTWDGVQTLRNYVDGVQDSTALGCNAGALATAAHLFIGKDNVTTGRQWTGRLNDVRIYNRVLSATEIANMIAVHN